MGIAKRFWAQARALRPLHHPCLPYHGYHGAGGHVADESWVERLPLQVTVVLSKDSLWRLGGIGVRGEWGLWTGSPAGHGGSEHSIFAIFAKFAT